MWSLLFSITGHILCVDCYVLMPCVQHFSLDVIMCMYGSLGYRLHTSLLSFTVCVSCFDAFSPCACVCERHSATACCLWCVSQPDSVCNVICSGLTEKDGWDSFRHNKRAEKVCGCVSVGGTQYIGMNLRIWILNPLVLQTLNSLLKVQNPGAELQALKRSSFSGNIFFATCASRQSACVSASVGHLRWSRAARCSLCSGKRSHSSEVWEEIQSTGWCEETGGCAFPLWEEKKKKSKVNMTKQE